MRIALSFLALLLFSRPMMAADSKEQVADDLFGRYQEALARQQPALKDITVEVLMEGKIPRLKKEGKMSAMKLVSGLGRVSWKMLSFWGDDTVKKEVMARYMTAEAEASSGKSEHNLGITRDNYEFKYKGLEAKEGRSVHVLELKPKHKRVGLFKGELWLDPDTSLPVREFGRLVKSPSLFIKKMEFVRDYEIRDGVSYLRRMESRTDTRIVGRAELNIEYANIQKSAPEPAAEEEAHGRNLR